MATELDFPVKQEIEAAISALNSDFCFYLDHCETEKLVALFSENALYTHGDRRSLGRDEITVLFESRNAAGTRTARHMQTGLRIQVIDENNAIGQSICMTFAADQPPPVSSASPYLVADFIDEYKKCADGCWRISRRHIERIFEASGNKGPVGSGS